MYFLSTARSITTTRLQAAPLAIPEFLATNIDRNDSGFSGASARSCHENVRSLSLDPAFAPTKMIDRRCNEIYSIHTSTEKLRGISLPPDAFSSDLQRFIFEYIDSIGLLEALLLLRSDPKKSWTPQTLSQELRNNCALANQYLKKMWHMKLVRPCTQNTDAFTYDDSQSGFNQIINELAEAHHVQRHRIYELIYSPFKKMRDFSDAFRFKGSDRKEDKNG
jgi:hypothetical protein